MSLTDSVSVFVNYELVAETIYVAPINPESDSYSRNELQGKVELYDSAISTESATIQSSKDSIHACI